VIWCGERHDEIALVFESAHSRRSSRRLCHMIGTKERAKYQRWVFLVNLTPENHLPNRACKIGCGSSRVQANQESARA
jgi:hypothetical protein